jgi:hypothetical protein
MKIQSTYLAKRRQFSPIMDQISIKTPNPKCRLYWCLIEFIDLRYSQSCWYFRPLLWTSAPLTFSLVHLPPCPPFPVWISTGVYFHTDSVYPGRGGGSGCVESIYRSYTMCISPDSEPTNICFTSPNKALEGRGPQTDKHLPSSTFLYWSIFKKSPHLGFGVFIYIWSMSPILTEEELPLQHPLPPPPSPRPSFCMLFSRLAWPFE